MRIEAREELELEKIVSLLPQYLSINPKRKYIPWTRSIYIYILSHWQ